MQTVNITEWFYLVAAATQALSITMTTAASAITAAVPNTASLKPIQ
jgi:hypothetical protein